MVNRFYNIKKAYLLRRLGQLKSAALSLQRVYDARLNQTLQELPQIILRCAYPLGDA